jgi:hypothetical protein
MKDEEQRLAAKPLRRKFRTLCIDAPWAYSGVPEKARPTYATMYASVEAPKQFMPLRINWTIKKAASGGASPVKAGPAN